MDDLQWFAQSPEWEGVLDAIEKECPHLSEETIDTENLSEEAEALRDSLKNDPTIRVYFSMLRAIEKGILFSYNLDLEALTRLLQLFYDTSFRQMGIEPELREKLKKAYTAACLSYFRQRTSSKMVNACQELLGEALAFSQAWVLKNANAPASLVKKAQISKKTFETLLVSSRENYIAPLKEHFLNDSSGPEAKYNLAGLSNFYKSVLLKWKKAKREAIKDQKDPYHKHNWRDRLNAYELPEDLIEWLNQSEANRDEIMRSRTDFPYLQKKLENKDKDYVLIKPSEIALEHSARLCGAEPYFYSVAHLFDVMGEER